MDRPSRHTRQGRAAKSRTSNACEACKRRKTKCSGGPRPCDVCKRADTFCNFNPKLDTRRKVSYSETTIQDRQQFMLTGLLQTIKHIPERDLQHLMSLIRGPSRPDAVATCLKEHFSTLQSKGLIPPHDIDDTDVISFGLQGLCGHRKGRAPPGSPQHSTDQTLKPMQSPAAVSFDSQDSSQARDETSLEPINDESSPDSPKIETDQLFHPGGDFDSDMFDDPFHDQLMQHENNNQFSFEQSSSLSQHASNATNSSIATSYTSGSSNATHSPTVPDTVEGFSPSQVPPHTQPFYLHMQPHSLPTSGSNHSTMYYYQAFANRLPTTLNPSIALKLGTQAPLPQSSGSEIPSEFSNSSYAFPPLRSNA